MCPSEAINTGARVSIDVVYTRTIYTRIRFTFIYVYKQTIFQADYVQSGPWICCTMRASINHGTGLGLSDHY